MVMKIWLQFCFISLAFAHPAVGQSVSDPARIEVYITPYYNSDGPIIEVGRYSKGLAAKNEPEFLETILKMKQSWSELRFPELYVAAIRLYDLGFRTKRPIGFIRRNTAAVSWRAWSIWRKWEAWVLPGLS